MKNWLTPILAAALLAAATPTFAQFAPDSDSGSSSGWDLSGVFDGALESVGISQPTRGVAKTPVATPTPDLTPYEERYSTSKPAATPGVPTCYNRNAVSQNSAAQYKVQPVSRAY